MKKPTAYGWLTLLLCTSFLLCCWVWLLHHRTTAPGWQVQTERWTPIQPVSSTSPNTDGLLPGEIIDLNHASRSDLMRLPDIGVVRADAILDYRAQHGGFRSVNDLLKVPGIGSVLLEQLRPFVMVAKEAPNF